VQDEGPYEEVPTIVVERYKYILNQIHVVNENVYRFFAIFQALATAMVTAALGLFVGYSKWGISAETARIGVRGGLVLTTAVAAFTVLMVVIGILSWLDYRREECELTEKYFVAGFRTVPRVRNFYRWYETYIVLFIVSITAVLWILGESILVARIR
jgi:hypothetical protein